MQFSKMKEHLECTRGDMVFSSRLTHELIVTRRGGKKFGGIFPQVTKASFPFGGKLEELGVTKIFLWQGLTSKIAYGILICGFAFFYFVSLFL